MNVKRFMLAMAAAAMLTALTASGASAAAKPGGEWYVEGTGTLEEAESVECVIGEHEGESVLKLTGFIGTTEVPITLEATGLDCINGTIFNESGAGRGAVKLTLTGVTIAGGLGEVCSIRENRITTNNLAIELYMDSEDPEITFERIVPGEAVNFTVVHIEGASCPVSGNKPTKGVLFGEATNATGVHSATQPLTFDEEIDATAGSEVEFAGNPVHVDGQVVTYLSGANAGKEFWAE